MRFPRNVRIIRGQFDVAAFVGVLFLLVIFLLLHSGLVFTPGVPIRLPQATGLPGLTNATVTVAVDSHGQMYFENQLADDAGLRQKLIAAVAQAPEPLTLVVQADRAVTHEVLMKLSVLARDAGINDAFFAVRPGPLPAPRPTPSP